MVPSLIFSDTPDPSCAGSNAITGPSSTRGTTTTG